MPTDVTSIRREHVEAIMTDQLARLARPRPPNRYSKPAPVLQLAGRGGRGQGQLHDQMRESKVPEHAPPILTNGELTAILRACEGSVL